MDHFGLNFRDHLGRVAEASPNAEALCELLHHQLLSVAGAHDLASRDALDLRSVRVRNLSTPYDRDFKHFPSSLRQLRKNRARPSRVDTLGAQPNTSLSFSLLYLAPFQ